MVFRWIVERLGLALVLWGSLLGVQGVAGAATERIRTFESRMVIHADAAVTVTERITVVSAGQEIKRGIFRELPTQYRDRYGNAVKVDLEILEIRRDGQPEPYHVEKAANGIKIYIGQKDVFLPPGQYTFTIVYRTDRQLGYFPDYDELYWNVTGTGWSFPIDAVRAEVVLPPGATIKQHAGYTGPFGATGKDYRVSFPTPGVIVFSTTRGLGPHEGLTIAVAWPKGLVREPAGSEKAWLFFRDNASLLSALLGFLGLLGYYYSIWSQVGRDPARGQIIPLFEPPAGFSPGASRYLMRMGFDAKTFAATVIDMAVKGFLTLRETDSALTLEKKNTAAQLFPEEQRLGQNLFSWGDRLEIDEKNQKTIASSQESLKASLKKTLSGQYFKTNRQYLWPAAVITLATLAAVIMTADDPSTAAASLVFYVVAGVAVGVFYFHWQGRHWLKRIILLGFGGFWVFLALVLGPAAAFGSMAAPLILGGILVLHLLFGQLLKAPTVRGRQVMDQMEGFKMYLGTAEQDRLEFLHPPAKTPELFEKYLPYALALDVENEWSEQFTDVLAQAAAEPYQPTWYSGSSWNTRNLGGFSNTLGSGLASAIAAAATPPSSSSGSGGGGSSGGGGGGGGGGGW